MTPLLIIATILLGAILLGVGLLVRYAAKAQAQADESADHLRAIRDHLAPAPVTVGYPVTVHTKRPDDQSIHGILLHEYPERIELVEAHLVDQPKMPIPGTVRIATANILWRQDHPAASDASDS